MDTAATLEAAIVENPDDDAAYLVYADWLLAQGDPRGELIMLQHDADEATGARKTTLRRAANALLDKHAAYFRGPLANTTARHDAVWRYGFVRKLALQWNEGRHRPSKGALELLAAVLQHPSYRMIVDLQIGRVIDDNWELDIQGVIDTLTELRAPPAVRTLDLGVTPNHRVTTNFAELSELVAALPRLQRIRLRERRSVEPSPDDPVHEIAIQRAKRRR